MHLRSSFLHARAATTTVFGTCIVFACTECGATTEKSLFCSTKCTAASSGDSVRPAYRVAPTAASADCPP